MKLDIKNETYNRFLKRKELDLQIEHPEEATPSTAAIQQLLAKQINAEAEKIEVKNIVSSRGSPMSKSLIFVWDEKKIIKKDMTKEKPAEEKKAEKAKNEPVPEETKTKDTTKETAQATS